MILKVFGVYDSKALGYLQPFFSNSVGSAIRAFADAANEDRSPIAKHAGDYQLYELGAFDDCSGLLTALVPNKMLGCAADFVEIRKGVPSLGGIVRQEMAAVDDNGGK